MTLPTIPVNANFDEHDKECISGLPTDSLTAEDIVRGCKITWMQEYEHFGQVLKSRISN